MWEDPRAELVRRLLEYQQVREVVVGGTQAVWAIHSTVHPDTVLEVAQRATVLDAPVTGGHDAAGRGELVVMIGGDPAVLTRVQVAFAPFAYETRDAMPLPMKLSSFLPSLLFALASPAHGLPEAFEVGPEQKDSLKNFLK